MMNHVSASCFSGTNGTDLRMIRFPASLTSEPVYGCAHFARAQTRDGLNVIPVCDRPDTTRAKESEKEDGGKRALVL